MSVTARSISSIQIQSPNKQEVKLSLDAIIIADSGADSFSGTNPLKLVLDGRIGNVQTVRNFVENNGRVIPPVAGDGIMSWQSALKLNGIYLWSFLHRQGFETALVDSFYEQQEQIRVLLSEGPHTVIISTTFVNSKGALKKMAHDLRRMAPQVKIVVGGAFVFMSYFLLQKAKEPDYHVSQAGRDFLFFEKDADLPVDLFVTGSHGEDILCRVLEQFRRGNRLPSDLPNTATISANGYHFGPQTDDGCTEQHAIDWGSAPDHFFSSGVVPLQASIGCPYHCAFCTFVKNKRRAWVKPLDDLIDEMKAVRSRGARFVWFVDDNFRLGKKDLEQVCKRMIQEDLGLRWMSFIRAGTLDQVDVQTLRRAGCIEVQLGLESADDTVLHHMNKQATAALYDRVLDKVRAAGINCSCYLIFGFPGETQASCMRTIEFMRRHDEKALPGSLNWSLFPFVLAPLSPIYSPAERSRYRMSGYMKQWQHATMNAGQAIEHLFSAFSALENSGVIYRGDNQEMLHKLGSAQRRRFHAARQKLSRAAFGAPLQTGDIVEAFKNVF
jgi:anaerobic magnesium-protoporphyrin IX monomethyl ester cyclase